MKKTLSIILSLLFVISIFTSCGTSTKKKNLVATNDIITNVYPADCEVSIHTKKQVKYLDNNYDKLPLGVKGEKELSRPEAVEFQWEYTEEKTDNTQYVLKISEDKDMSNPMTYTTSSETFSVYNLKIATTYYWTVTVNEKTSDVYSFTTDNTAPRNLYVDGITNVRDIGGWVTEKGTRTNQGLLYRCSRLNNSKDNGCAVIITEDGKRVMLNDLGIKTEIDLRQIENGETGGVTSSPLGETVNYISCPMDHSGDVLSDNKEQILKVFEVLADEDNYPMIIHCSIGTDRTGMLSFLINALLGVPQEDLYRDYLFSNFADIGSKRKITNMFDSEYYKKVMDTDGSSLSEKTYNCLVDFGVPAEHLDSLISILTK
ncbi:MAG: tyrosine-protein phosphatase [Clostridia bacterium]|nr:tyrosine-protein phosphatase [Clostridia bacterium]